MRYYYTNNIVSFNLFGYDIEVANVGGREWRLAIVEQKGAVLNSFNKAGEGEYADADYGDIAGTSMFWHFDKAPTLGEIIKTIREYRQHRAEHEEFMKLIGAKA